MKTVTGYLRATIEQEQERVSQHLLNLHQENERDSATVKSLKEAYSKAVFDTDAKLMDEFNTQIKEIAKTIQERKDLIKVLSDKNNPVIQRTVAEASKVWMEQIKQIDDEAGMLYKELEQHHKKVVDGLEKLQLYREQAHRLEGYLDDYNKFIPDDSREALGLPKTIKYHTLADIRKYMNPLLITHYVKPKGW